MTTVGQAPAYVRSETREESESWGKKGVESRFGDESKGEDDQRAGDEFKRRNEQKAEEARRRYLCHRMSGGSDVGDRVGGEEVREGGERCRGGKGWEVGLEGEAEEEAEHHGDEGDGVLEARTVVYWLRVLVHGEEAEGSDDQGSWFKVEVKLEEIDERRGREGGFGIRTIPSAREEPSLDVRHPVNRY